MQGLDELDTSVVTVTSGTHMQGLDELDTSVITVTSGAHIQGFDKFAHIFEVYTGHFLKIFPTMSRL